MKLDLATAEPVRPTLIAGRPFGLSPTFWTMSRGVVHTARRASDLVPADRAPAVDRLAALICYAEPLGPDDSLFDQVRRVPPDSVVHVHRDGTYEVRETTRTINPLSISPIAAADRLWRLVLAGVGRQLAGAKRVAVLTGGGVDSGALLCAAVGLGRKMGVEVHAIALHFGGVGDDRPYMVELERRHGVVVHRVTPAEAAPYMRPLLDNASMPIWAPSAAGDFAVLRRAHEIGADVVLTGTGGDDLFDGYPSLLADELVRGDVAAIPLARRLSVPWQSTASERLVDFIVRPLVARAIPRSVQRRRRQRFYADRWPWAGPCLRAYAERESHAWRRARIATPLERFDRLAKAAYMVDVIEYFDELSSLAGVQLRHPYLDEELLAFTASLPPKMFFQGDRLRGLFRLAARGSLPEKVRLRRDKARFNLARQEMLKLAGGHGVFSGLATMAESEKVGLVDPKGFLRAFEAFPRLLEVDDTAWTWLWPALSIEAFLRERASAARA